MPKLGLKVKQLFLHELAHDIHYKIFNTENSQWHDDRYCAVFFELLIHNNLYAKKLLHKYAKQYGVSGAKKHQKQCGYCLIGKIKMSKHKQPAASKLLRILNDLDELANYADCRWKDYPLLSPQANELSNIHTRLTTINNDLSSIITQMIFKGKQKRDGAK